MLSKPTIHYFVDLLVSDLITLVDNHLIISKMQVRTWFQLQGLQLCEIFTVNLSVCLSRECSDMKDLLKATVGSPFGVASATKVFTRSIIIYLFFYLCLLIISD